MKVFIDPRSTISYSSYYIQGLYDFFGKGNVRFSSKYFGDLKEIDMLMAFVIVDSKMKKFIVDYRDQDDVIEDAFNWSDTYAKINVSEATLLNNDNNKLINIPPSFGIKVWNPVELLFHLGENFFKAKIITHLKDKNIHLNLVRWARGYLTLLKRQPLQTYTKPKKSDPHDDKYVFFISTLWQGSFVDANLYRQQYMLTCSENKDINFNGGFFVNKNRKSPDHIPHKLLFNKFFSNKLYLENMKKSIFVFNTPAVLNCHGWKLGEFLCMGKAMISMPLVNKLPFPLEHGKDIYIVNNEQEIKDAVTALLKDKDLRIRLEKSARAYYEKYASPFKVIERIVRGN